MVETIVIPFQGEDSGECELTWGQRHIWDWIQSSGSPLSMTAVRALAEDAKVDQFVDELRFFLDRFQAMRTRLRRAPDGSLRQVVARSGEATLEIVDVDPDADPATVAEEIAARHRATHFDYFHEWPVRMAAVRRRGVLTHTVITLCHLFFDAAAAMVMFADLLDRDPDTGRPRGPVAGITPLGLAAWQGSPAGIRQSATALRYWESQLRALPATGGPDAAGDTAPGGSDAASDTASGGPDAAGYWQLEYDSPAMDRAVHALADRLAADSASVLLAVYAVALARVTGRNPGALEIIASNRFRPGNADIVSPVNQAGLCVLDVAGISFQRAVELVRRRAFTAYKHAYFDPVQQQEMIARVSRERGVDLGLGYFVNDRRTRTTPPAGTDARPGGAVRWERLESFNKRLMVYFNDSPDAVAIMLQANCRYVSRSRMEALVREMEAVALAAAADPTRPTGVPVRPA